MNSRDDTSEREAAVDHQRLVDDAGGRVRGKKTARSTRSRASRSAPSPSAASRIRLYARASSEDSVESAARIMAWTGAGERTVKGWLAASHAPRAFQLECLFRSSEAVYERIVIRTGRQPVVNRERLEAVSGQLTGLAGAIDAALS
jgi:hypothetical protein